MPDKLSNNSPILSNSLSDSEIVKVLECFVNEACPDCESCSYYDYCQKRRVYIDVFDLINRLQAKNSNLTSDLTSLQNDLTSLKAENEKLKKSNEMFTDIGKLYSEIKAEAYKECIEKVKALFPSDNEPYQYWEIHEGADNLLKKLVGEGGGNK